MAATHLVIDWGNTSLKAAWFRPDQRPDVVRYATPDALLADLDVNTAELPAIISSTSGSAEVLADQLRQRGFAPVLALSATLPVPLRVAYATPQSLGTDRVAAAVGAAVRFPGEACLILNLGTCLTADRVSADGTFLGGLIAPGLAMRLRAMHEFTQRLPDVAIPADHPPLVATSTAEAMQSGAVNGLLFELEGNVAHFCAEQPGGRVLLCGGDAPTFENRLKGPIFAVPELVLLGLNRILEFNLATQHT